MNLFFRISLATLFLLASVPLFDQTVSADEPTREITPLMDLQVPLIKNIGQFDPAVKYSTATFLGQVLVTNQDLTYIVPKYSSDSSDSPEEIPAVVLKESFVGASELTFTNGASSATKANFYNLPGADLNNVQTYDEIYAEEVWAGIKLTLRAGYSNLEKIFEVKAGANPALIKMRIEGILGLAINQEGQLVATSELGDVVFSKPIAWQQIGTKVQEVEVDYQLTSNDQYGFTLGAYDPEYPILIDPLIVATYVGGTGTDSLIALTSDTSGNIYAVGNASASNGLTGAPYTPPGPGVGTVTATQDVVVFKINSNLTTLSSWAVLGGSATDTARDIVVGTAGDVFILSSCQTAFPTTIGAYDTTFGGATDICLSRLSSNLNSLVASTFIGAAGTEAAGNLVYDQTNDRLIFTGTAGTGYPTTCTLVGACTPFQTAFSASTDFVISVFNPSLSGPASLLSSTYYGGAGAEVIPGNKSLALDLAGNIIFTGQTASSGLATIGAYDSTAISGIDAIVAKFDQSLSSTSRIAATYFAETSGTTTEAGYAVVVDAVDQIYLLTTFAANTAPITFGSFDQIYNGGTSDLVLAKFSSNLATLVASTYLGGAGNDLPASMILDGYGSLVIAGSTTAALSVNPTACYPNFVTSTEGIIIKISTDLTAPYSASYFSGTGNADAVTNLIIKDDLIHIVGNTNTTGLSGGFDTLISGADGFIAKLDPDLCVAPSVTNITSSAANGIYKIGDIIPIVVTFSGPVNAIGIPSIILEAGTTDPVINYSSGTGTNTLTFNYTVASGESNSDLDYLSTVALAPQIKSIGGTDATLTLPQPGDPSSLSYNKDIVIDGIAPSSPIISSPVSGSITNDSTPGLLGLAEAGATVNIYQGMTNLCSAVADGFGIWSCTLSALADNSYSLTGVVTDIAGNESVPLIYSLIVDTTAPSFNSLTSPSTGAILNDSAPLVSGITEPFAEVRVLEGLQVLCTTVADAIGGWSCATTSLSEGDHAIFAVAIDAANNYTNSASITVTVDTLAPSSVAIIYPSETLIIGSQTPSISGIGESGTNVEVKDGPTTLCATTISAGVWSCVSSELSAGSHQLVAISTDVAGNSVTSVQVNFSVDTDLPAAPVITSPANNAIVQDTTPLIIGTAEANSTVSIYDGLDLLGTVQAGVDGSWSYATGRVLTVGAHSINVQSTDTAGNTSAQSGITLNIVSLTVSGCTLVSYQETLTQIASFAKKIERRVASAGRLNSSLASAGICRRVASSRKNNNISLAATYYSEIFSLTQTGLPSDNLYNCVNSTPAGCSLLPVDLVTDTINARAASLENLVDLNFGSCERFSPEAARRARKVRKFSVNLEKLTQSINSTTLQCLL